ncbi:ABC transporter permease [Nocardioides sp.]|uniref:ABC transporter permease n=1 Tax=Nocardioides sp. TaxID=35761 RepID=UPI0039E4A982
MTTAPEPKPELTDERATPRRRFDPMAFLERYALVLLVVVLCLFFACYGPTHSVFPTAANWRNMLGNQTVVAVAALAILLPLMCNQFDLSIGANIGLSAITAAACFERLDAPWILALLVGVLTGLVVGVVNGLIVVRFGVMSLIATLGTTSLIEGFVSWFTHGQFIQKNVPTGLVDFGAKLWVGVPRVTFAVAAIALVVYYLQQHTPYGRELASIGDNPVAARLNGINVKARIFSSFAASGVLAGVAGVLLLARSGAGNPQVGPGYTLAALSAAFLGATAIRPGRFNVIGTVVGVLLVAVSVNGLVLAGAADWVEPAFDGAALLGAVGIAAYITRRRSGQAT